MAEVQENLIELKRRVTILMSDIMENRVKMLTFEMELKDTKVKLEETGKRLEETEKKQEEAERKLKKTEEKLEKTVKKQEKTERKLMETEQKREKAERELHEHLSQCQSHLGGSASSREDDTIRDELNDLGHRVDVISTEIIKVKQLKSLCEMSMIKKATKSIAETDRIDDMQAVVGIVNDDINELKKTTASMSKQLKQVTAPVNQGQTKTSQGLPMATTGRATGLQAQSSSNQCQPNATRVQTVARVNPHYYYSFCSNNIEVDHTNGILSRKRQSDRLGFFKSAQPLCQRYSSFSVEITGRGDTSWCCVTIGLVDKDRDVERDGLGGRGTVKYWDDRVVWVSDQRKRLGQDNSLGVGTVMKIGVRFGPRRSVQCYENGREVFNHPLEAADFRHQELYPVVRLRYQGTSVRLLDADAWRA